MPHLPLTLVYRQKFIQDQLNESAETKKKMFEACSGDILKAVDVLINAFNKKKKVLICGNGGSAADAQHIATELVIRMTKPNRPALAAIALTTDSSMLTAGGNDIGFENVFARQVEALGVPRQRDARRRERPPRAEHPGHANPPHGLARVHRRRVFGWADLGGRGRTTTRLGRHSSSLILIRLRTLPFAPAL